MMYDVRSTYLVEGGVDIEQADGVDTQTKDINGNQGDQGLGDILLERWHLHSAQEIRHSEQEHGDQHLDPEQGPRQLQ